MAESSPASTSLFFRSLMPEDQNISGMNLCTTLVLVVPGGLVVLYTAFYFLRQMLSSVDWKYLPRIRRKATNRSNLAVSVLFLWLTGMLLIHYLAS
jgi:hypothetical protein